MITWNDLTAELQHNLAAVATGTEIAYRYWEDLHNSGLATLDGQYRMRLTDAGRAVLAQKPANDSGSAVDVRDYQQAIRNLRETIAALKSEMHEIAVLLKYGEINADRAAFMLERVLDGEVSSEP